MPNRWLLFVLQAAALVHHDLVAVDVDWNTQGAANEAFFSPASPPASTEADASSGSVANAMFPDEWCRHLGRTGDAVRTLESPYGLCRLTLAHR